MKPVSWVFAFALFILTLATARAEDIYWGKDLTLKGESVGEPLDLATLKGKPFIIFDADGKMAGFYGDTGEAKRAVEKLVKGK